MNKWIGFCSEFLLDDSVGIEQLRKSAEQGFEKYHIYPNSIHRYEETILFIVMEELEKKLVVLGTGTFYEELKGQQMAIAGQDAKVCALSHQNCLVIREKFPFTAPTAVLKHPRTFGLGDRLGLATPGHIKLFKQFDVKPVFAQQSVRELNLTGRTFDDVLDDVSWAVFQEDFKSGFGADGDHLKRAEEVKMALDSGVTMITLDCSEYINNDVVHLSNEKISELYINLHSLDARQYYEDKYLKHKFKLESGYEIEFEYNDLAKIILIYKKALDFAVEIYNKYISKYERAVDFEISIDETLTPTSLQAHYLVAAELADAHVEVATLAPRFCGEFQKGIDYIGDVEQFEHEFKIHAAIAEHFGYRISIHSGSDKFSVFPIIGRETNQIYHVKTAGTNWLEAVRVIAKKAPELYREMHLFALDVLEQAKKYYHIGADVKKIPDISMLSDEELPALMDQVDSRQVLHITYGLILQAKKEDGQFMFKDRIYEVLNRYEQDYIDGLAAHIGRHLRDLGVER